MYKNILLFLFNAMLMSGCFTTNDPLEPAEQINLKKLWHHNYESVDAPNHVPFISKNEELIIMSGDSHLSALFTKDGKIRWQVEDFGNFSLAGAIILQNGDQIFSNHKDELICWSIDTGERKWTFSVESPLTLFEIGVHAVIENGYAVVGTGSQIYTINKNGELIYVKQLSMGTANVESSAKMLFVGQGKTIHGGLTLGRITAMDATSGDSLWAYDTKNGGFTWAPPFAENGILYAATFGNSPLDEAVALDAETGEVIWRYTSDYLYTRNAAMGPEHFYINTGGSLVALDKQTGDLDWREIWLGTASTKPVYLGGYVYFTDYGEIKVIDDETGEVVHREPTPDGTPIWHVAASSDKIFAQTSRQLIAYQPWHLREDR